MKMILSFSVCAGLVATVYLLTRAPGLPVPEIKSREVSLKTLGSPESLEKAKVVENLAARSAPPENHLPSPGEPAVSPAPEPVPNLTPMRAIATMVQTKDDFAKGDSDYLVVADGLKLAPTTPPSNQQTDYMFSGTFHSPEIAMKEPFTFLKAAYQATLVTGSADSAVGFAIRTKTADGRWSNWIEVSAGSFELSQMMDFPSISWQYRVALYGNSLAASPSVQSVTITTEENGPAMVAQEKVPPLESTSR